MKIVVIDTDSKMPNLALKKVEKYHKDRGDEVTWNFPLACATSDKIYVSCIFTWNKNKAKFYEQYPQAIIGGSGYNLKLKLPPEIEAVKPRINIGFTTRGCIRKCPFCIVPEKEGGLVIENHISELWDGQSDTIELLDNNWLANRKWFFENSQWLIDHKLKLKENGMDIRLVDGDIAQQLSKIRWAKQPHFAWDFLNTEKYIDSALPLLKKYKLNPMVYVLVNYNTTIEEDLYRIRKIKSYGCDSYVMVYNKPKVPQEIKHLARWNNRFVLRSQPFEEYLEIRRIKWTKRLRR